MKKMLCLTLVCPLFWSCVSPIPIHRFEEEIPKLVPDYTTLDQWIAHPLKFDNSDLLPKNLLDDTLCLDSIDVFFIHPTTYLKGDQWNADINNKRINRKTHNSTIKYQANVFCGLANVYAPVYRQIHIHGYKDNNNGLKAFDVAYKDIENAFKYYLKHYNNGNRIVIAAHSQGTNHAEKLFTDFLLENDSILQKVELAYLVGMPVHSLIKNYPACDDPLDKHCFLSWRTFSHGFYPSYKYSDKIAVTNPVNWRRNGAASLYNSHEGILFRDFKIKHPKSLSAVVHQGLLWVTFESFPMQKIFERNDYHIADYNLFWLNIRRNFYERMRYKAEDKITN